MVQEALSVEVAFGQRLEGERGNYMDIWRKAAPGR